MKKLIFFIVFCIFLNNISLVFGAEQPTIEPISTKETLIKTYEFAGNVDYEPLIPNNIEHKGETFIKKDIKVEEEKRTENVDITEPVEKIISESEKSKAISLFEKELNYNKNNLKGILKLDESSLKIVKNEIENVTKYDTKKYTIYEDKTYYGLESNDYSLLPQTIIKDGVVLKLITADFVKTNSKDTYNCNTQYGGTYTKKIPTTKQVVKNYKATVNYKGNIQKEIVDKRIVTVFYEQGQVDNNAITETKAELTTIDTTTEITTNMNNQNSIENEQIVESNKNDNQLFLFGLIFITMLFILVLAILFVLSKQMKVERSRKDEKKIKKTKFKKKYEYEDEDEY